MKMKFDFSPQLLLSILVRILHRYHVIIFVLTVIGGLSVATFMLSQAVNTPAAVPTTSTNNGFDTATIDKINNLRKVTDSTASLVLPSGRTNPFVSP